MASPEMAIEVGKLAEEEMIPAQFGRRNYPVQGSDEDLGPVKTLLNNNLIKSGIDPSKLPPNLDDGFAGAVKESAIKMAQEEVNISEAKLNTIDPKSAASQAVASPDNKSFVIDWEKVKAHAASQSASDHPPTPEQTKANNAQLKVDEDGIRKNLTATMQKGGILTDDPAAKAKLNEIMVDIRGAMNDAVKAQVSNASSAAGVQKQSVPVAPGSTTQKQL